MKKFFKIFLLFILVLPIVMISACTSPTKYQITVNPSDSSLGSVPQSSTLNLTPMDEGTVVKISAKENNPTTNPFICWVKDYKKIVSKEKTYELVYNSQSAGNYTALFQEDNVSKMMFASLGQINFRADSEAYSTISYTISYARTSTGSSTYSEFESGNFSLTSSYSTNNESLLYFGGAGANYTYKLRINIELFEVSGRSTSQVAILSDVISKADFDEDGKLIVTEYIPGLGDLTLSFQKITSALYQK